MNWPRRDNLIKDEQAIQREWDFTINADPQKPKFFGTFPFAYQNGTMHLGHAFTLSKLEFLARFKRLTGYHVLFPIGFHGTGMPIVACAGKLKESLSKYDIKTVDVNLLPADDQISILHKMGVSREEMHQFVDPYYWLKYFPRRTIEDLQKFGICADYTRCFVTTDLNPYFDSFVKWQFNLLNNRGYLKFGKKPIVYSPKDGQACADHDRSKGEGVNPKKYNVWFCPLKSTNAALIKYDNLVLAITENQLSADSVKSIIVHSDDTFVIAKYNGCYVVARPEFFRNLRHQVNTTDCPQEDSQIKGADLHGSVVMIGDSEFQIQDSKIAAITGSGTKVLLKSKDGSLKNSIPPAMLYYEPEEVVTSRTGDVCVVAITDQWFIDYSSPALKEKVNKYIREKLVMCPEAKNMLLAASEWINEWPCSRSYGLGTKLLDTPYVIDSLSDSTIYMAYYTVAHKIETIPIQYVNDSLWDYLFRKGCLPPIPAEYIATIQQLRAEFHYWYPVDLRVSGKDLICNHLLMCLYNHFMIWDSPDMLPRNYHTNGYIMLNSKKMSKHDGNFMTLREAVTKYGSDATRIAIAEASGSGGGLDDANFVEKNAEAAILKLDTEKTWCMEVLDKLVKEGPLTSGSNSFWDDVFEQEIRLCMMEVEQYYDQMEYQKVLANGFHKMISVRDNYRVKCEAGIIAISNAHLKVYIENFLLLTYPICPHFVEHLWNYAAARNIPLSHTWIHSDVSDRMGYRLICYRDVINEIIDTARSNIGAISKKLSKKQTVDIHSLTFTINITCYNNYSENERSLLKEIMNRYNVSSMDTKAWKLIGQQIMTTVTDKKLMQHYGKFIGYVQDQVTTYGPIWFDLVMDASELNHIIETWIPKIYRDKNVTAVNITLSNGTAESMFKNGPMNPLVKVVPV